MTTTKQVVLNTLSSEYNHYWNTGAYSKNHSSTYTLSGGLWINAEPNDWQNNPINWASYDPIYMINNGVSEDSIYLGAGLTPQNVHDAQTCLFYLQSVANYVTAFPSDTTFNNNNGAGFMGLSAFVDHISKPGLGLGDFQPYPAGGSQIGSYSNPKGWVYFALLDCYLKLKNNGLLTGTQVTNLQNSVLYAAWTYYNSYSKTITYDGTSIILTDTDANTYVVSEVLLCAAALIDAAQRFPSQIVTGMFQATNTTPQSPTLWTNLATQAASNLLNRGAFNSTYNMFYNNMQLNITSATDTPLDTKCKGTTQAEACEALIHLGLALPNSAYLTQAKTALNAYSSGTYSVWDATRGGFYFAFDMSNGTLSTTYKETRSTAEMLRTFYLYNSLVSPDFQTMEQSCINAMINSFWRNGNIPGFWYRQNANFTVVVDAYSNLYTGATLQANTSIGATSVPVTQWPAADTQTSSTVVAPGSVTCTVASTSKFTVGNNILITGGTGTPEVVSCTAKTSTTFTATFANAHSGTWTAQPALSRCVLVLDGIDAMHGNSATDEEAVFDTHLTTGTASPFTIAVNANYNGGSGLKKAHNSGVSITSILNKINESQITSEACGVCSAALGLTLATPTASDAYGTAILGDSPQAYYRLDETSGLIAHDFSGNGYDAALKGNITYSQPGALINDSDTSMTFDAHATLTVPYTLNYNTFTSFSLEYWINVASIGTGWHHIVVTYTAGTTLTYFDSVIVTPGSIGDPEIEAAFAWAGSSGVNGFDEIAIYNYVLTQTQISNHYRIGSGAHGATAIPAIYGNFPYERAVSADNPVAYLRLGEPYGQNAYDTAGNGNAGLITGAVTQQYQGALVKDPDYACLFDGASGAITLPIGVNPSAYSALSVECWFYVPTGASLSASPSLWANEKVVANNKGIACYLTATTANFALGTGSANTLSTTNFTWANNTWYHLVCTWDGSNMRTYINGFLRTTTAFAGPIGSTSFAITIGHNPNNTDYFPGAIDEWAIYRAALSANRVGVHYATGASEYAQIVLNDTPIRYYRLNEPSGTTAYDIGSQAQNGTLNGTVTLAQPGLVTPDITDASMLGDGSTGYISCPTTNLPAGASPISFEFWFQISSTLSGFQMPISLGTRADGQEIDLNFSGASGLVGELIFELYNAGQIYGIVPANNVPHHVAITYDGVTFKLYLDGVLLGIVAAKANVTYGAFNIMAQAGLNNNFFPGKVSDVAVYSYALTASQVSVHYNASLVIPFLLVPVSQADLSIFKEQQVRVYTSGGSYLGTWIDAPLLAGFKETMNAATSAIQVELPRSFDNFNADGTIGQGNTVEYWLYGPGLPRTGFLRFRGTIDQYAPQIKEDGAETLTVTVTPKSAAIGDSALAGIKAFGTVGQPLTYVDVLSMFTYWFNNGDPNTGQTYTSPLTLAPGVPASSGRSAQYTFQNQTLLSMFQTILLMLPPNWFFRCHPDGTVYINAAPTTAQHFVDIAQHVVNPQYSLDWTQLKNIISVTGQSQSTVANPNILVPIVQATVKSGDVSSFGARYQFANDSRVTDQQTVNILANGLLNALDRFTLRTKLRIPDYRGGIFQGLGYDIESLRVGDTIQLVDSYGAPSQTALMSVYDQAQWDQQNWDAGLASVIAPVTQIISLDYHWFYVDVELGALQPNQDFALFTIQSKFTDYTMV